MANPTPVLPEVGSTIVPPGCSRPSRSAASIMVTALLLMTLAAWAYAIAVALIRVRAIIVERERGALWLSHLPEMRRLVV